MSGTPPLQIAKAFSGRHSLLFPCSYECVDSCETRQKAHGVGLSGEHVGEQPPVLIIFPVDFPDTGNLVAETSWLQTGPTANDTSWIMTVESFGIGIPKTTTK